MHYPAMVNALQDMEDLLERLVRGTGRHLPQPQGDSLEPDWIPAADIDLSPRYYKIRVELPGVSKKDMFVNYSDGLLSITGIKQAALKSDYDSRRQQSECIFGHFARDFHLDDVEDPQAIKARFENGVLFLTVPRRNAGIGRATSIRVD